MSIKHQILEIFEENRGSYISGGSLAKKLNVSRNAVWKVVKALQDEGYEINAVTNKGYCLSPETDILSSQSIAKYLNDSNRNLDLRVYKTISSTNSVLKEMADKDAPEGTVLVSEEQTAGRGRMGRSFFSPAGTGIYMSILLRPELTASDSLYLTTSAAVAVAQAIETIADVNARIKWVNDIFCNGKKVCGILTEASFNLENNGLSYAVVGIGINVKEPEGGFPDDVKNIATAIFSNSDGHDTPDARSRLIAEILNRFMSFYRNIKAKTFLKEYRNRSMLMGRQIDVLDGKSVRTALALDIDDDCRLKVKFEDDTVKYLSSGEVSIKVI